MSDDSRFLISMKSLRGKSTGSSSNSKFGQEKFPLANMTGLCRYMRWVRSLKGSGDG